MNNFITRSIGLLLIGGILSGCIEKQLDYDTFAEFIIINETDSDLHMAYYYYSSESSFRLREENEDIAVNDSFRLVRCPDWNSKCFSESKIFESSVMGYPREDTRIIFSDDSGKTVVVWYAKDADSQPGNFFRQDSWEYEQGPHIEPYSDGATNKKHIVWTYHIRKNQ